jgi:4'-phosphopantetheinyl transferase EntD
MESLHVIVAAPATTDEGRALAFRCALEATRRIGAPVTGSHWPRAGLFALTPTDDRAFVSVTHAVSLVAAIASHAGPVGVDAEPWSRKAEAVRRILAPGEWAPLEAAATCAGFPPELAVWCAKEAVGKALGRGLTDASRWRLVPTAEATLWQREGTPAVAVRLLRYRDTLLAVAIPAEKSPQPIEIVVL